VMASFRFNIFRKHNATLIAALFIPVLIIGALASGMIMQRVEVAMNDLQEISKNDFSSSLGSRVILWKAGAQMIVERPLLGYGPGNVEGKISEIDEDFGTPVGSFTHFHNVVINELVRAGVVGLVALMSMFAVPLYFVFRAPKTELRSWALAMLTGSQAAYLLSGMAGIMIGHDILDTLFIVVTVLCLYLVRPEYNLMSSQQ
jgi:O-antigen ligase